MTTGPAARDLSRSLLYDRSGLLRPLASLEAEIRRRRVGARRRRQILRTARRLWGDHSHEETLPQPARDQDETPGEEAD